MDLYEEARAFGIIEIPTWQRDCFRVFINQHHIITLYTTCQPIRVYWSGLTIVVEMENGEIRRYRSLSDSDYQVVYT
jgi:hypothetical protein